MMTDQDILNLFEQLFAAQRHEARCTERARIAKLELEAAELEASEARARVAELMAKVGDKARQAAGVSSASDRDEVTFVGQLHDYIPVR